MHPLRGENGLNYRQYHNRILAIGAEMKKKRRQSQVQYRRNKHLRNQMDLDDHPAHDGQDGFSDPSNAESEMTQMAFCV
ncbi:hypothetical protein PF010_g5620 [Phytophthora fragariae]|uniref:Uncharacterized protein n=1 Tax=Phytophthora fragariae TaxID=53985 RepID=A0A6G0S5N6_9STRA|nr:hypothetical protein PF010_g5620 [Phytophthora fragariae]KAE9243611.1 hypothetical protein PF004_g6060 [Phytophthora fragariae]KAE9350586.1 hypothetical protein PF008_g6364 [Phytophthora fragariae]